MLLTIVLPVVMSNNTSVPVPLLSGGVVLGISFIETLYVVVP